jgi:hypothetical protein
MNIMLREVLKPMSTTYSLNEVQYTPLQLIGGMRLKMTYLMEIIGK